jgi:Lon protease-like protein
VTERIPLFPLGSVLFPGLVLPLHIFEERYRLLVRTLVDQPEQVPRRFGVVAIRQGWEVGDDAVKALHEVGCAADLRAVESHDDGRFDIVTTGASRFVIRGLDRSLPYLQGDVDWLDEPDGDDAEAAAERTSRAFLSYRKALMATKGQADDGGGLPERPTALSYLVGAAMVLQVADKQRILAAADTTERLHLEAELLAREDGVLRALPSLPAVEMTRKPYSSN